MAWAEHQTEIPALLTYERRVDDVLRSRAAIAVCGYDLERHKATTIAALLEAHPLVLINGAIRPRAIPPTVPPRDRILGAAHELFQRIGIRATGVDTIIEAASVAKATFYRQFSSKDELILAWLRDERPRWFDRVRDEVEAVAPDPFERVGLCFERTAAWLERDGIRGCAFQNAAVELKESAHPARSLIRDYLGAIESYLQAAARSCDVSDPEAVGSQLAALLAGAIMAAGVAGMTTPVLIAGQAAVRLVGRGRGQAA
jgi:AcrR family transcriptional regulator